jgi:hypothetical protein
VEYRMRQEAEVPVFNPIACAAAFAFVTLIAVFGHPPSRLDRAATMPADVAGGAQAISTRTPAGGSTAEDLASK